ncbi:alpha/beta hydrolase, partial [Streptomyces sp. H39-C1]|uniref:alpha/beta hydrolase n=1 Tax=Streptomyces sp. H39-C1 TaxID=3004355 RepID=UPI001278A841
GTPAPEHRHRNTGTGTPAPEHRHRNTGTGTPAPEHRHRNTGTGTPAPYATVREAGLFLKSFGLDGAFPAETLSATATNGRVGAWPDRRRHPLVVLSPGFGVSRFTLTGLAEELAGRGFVVAAMDHAYESVGTAFSGGRMLTCIACERARNEQDLEAVTAGRAKDVSSCKGCEFARHVAGAPPRR